MLTMADVNNIRFQFYHEGLNINEINKKTGHDRKTISKYIDQEDFNVTPAPTSTRCTKLDPFKDLIDSWLESVARPSESSGIQLLGSLID